MAQKKPLSDAELLAQLDGISGQARPSKPAAAAPPSAPAPLDALAELEKLESLAKAKGPAAALASSAGSRPHSPKPTPSSVRNSEDRSRRSAESGSHTTGGNAGLTPSSEGEEHILVESQQQQQAGGGWWGGLLATAASTATAAVKQAEAAYKEIQQNQEAQRWADQVRGNVGALRNLGITSNSPSI
jgi:Family of unknown function (DUF5427)